jgi:hypothetical protein
MYSTRGKPASDLIFPLYTIFGGCILNGTLRISLSINHLGSFPKVTEGFSRWYKVENLGLLRSYILIFQVVRAMPLVELNKSKHSVISPSYFIITNLSIYCCSRTHLKHFQIFVS